VASPAVFLAPGLWRIPTLPLDIVNTFAIVDEDGSVTLVDAGIPMAGRRIHEGLVAIGRHSRDVRRIILTHSHYDHAGSAGQIAQGTGARVIVHAEDAPFARAGKPPEPDGRFVATRLFGIAVTQPFPAVEVSDEVKDGDVLPIGGGLRVVHTPGHTPGHVSLLHEESRTLITGDTIMNVAGLRGLPAYVCHDYPLYQRTRHLLGELDYDVAAFTHGPEMRVKARERIRDWLRRRPVDPDPTEGPGPAELT
jgi:glyoxylase-like metal-dependent hydrolase (beta-lactamase superfamily II)